MINMISAKTLDNFEKLSNTNSDSEEKDLKTDEFTALLDGLFAAQVAIGLPVQNTPPGESPKDLGNLNQDATEISAPVDPPKFLQLAQTTLPGEIKDFSLMETRLKFELPSELYQAKSNETDLAVTDPKIELQPDANFGDKTVSEKRPENLFDFAKDNSLTANNLSDVPKSQNERFQNSELDNAGAQFEVVSDESTIKTSEKNILSGKNLLETNSALNTEKTESSNKLPKLFREVAGLLEVHNPNLTKETTSAETTTVADTSAETAFVEQIEPRLLELAAITARTNEKQVLKMKLHPAELGMVEIKIEKGENGKLTAHFQTESETSKQILTKNLDQLRDALQNSGWQIDKMEISSGSSSSSGFENRENQSRQSETSENNAFDALNSGGNSPVKDDLKENQLSRLLSLRA